MKIGQKVQVEKEGDFFFLRESSPPNPVPNGLKKWLDRTLSSPKTKKEENLE
jgi:hypothetical protein